MNLVITLDYEVYFGRRSGSVQRTLIEPTQALAALAQRHGVPLVFFVDVAYLLRLREEAAACALLRADLDRIGRQLDTLVAAGHELHLHIHPHWFDTPWDGQAWAMDLRRYRLQAFDDHHLTQIVAACAQELQARGGATRGLAFRAGGWCVQPFQRLRAPLLAAGVGTDSSVFAGGLQRTPGAEFNFRQAPQASRWRFDDDPLQPVAQGAFLELPIASHRVGPAFFWRLAWSRLRGGAQHQALGDGVAMRQSRADLAHKLLWPSRSVVSIDGLKARFLPQAYRDHLRRGCSDFVVIGHPKALTPYALQQLDHFLATCAPSVCGLTSYAPLAGKAPPASRVSAVPPVAPVAPVAPVPPEPAGPADPAAAAAA